MTMKDKWEIHDKLEEANQLINDKIMSIQDQDQVKEMLQMSIEIEKIMHQLVY